jgi:hypothetical protein
VSNSGSAALAASEDFVKAVFEAARQAPLPKAAGRFHLAGVKLLVAFYRELQRAAADTGGEVFYLSCRDAGRLLGVSHTTAAEWLSLLQRAKVIECLVRGSKLSMLASQYRYLAD